MENADLAVAIERFMRNVGLTHDDSIEVLVEALYAELREEFG